MPFSIRRSPLVGRRPINKITPHSCMLLPFDIAIIILRTFEFIFSQLCYSFSFSLDLFVLWHFIEKHLLDTLDLRLGTGTLNPDLNWGKVLFFFLSFSFSQFDLMSMSYASQGKPSSLSLKVNKLPVVVSVISICFYFQFVDTKWFYYMPQTMTIYIYYKYQTSTDYLNKMNSFSFHFYKCI